MTATKTKWQTLTQEDDERTDCLRVPGARLYRTTLYDDDGNPAWVSLAVLRDEPEHGR